EEWLSGYCLQQEHSLPIPKLEARAEVIRKYIPAPQPQIETSPPNSSSGRSHVLPAAALWKKTRSKLNQIAMQRLCVLQLLLPRIRITTYSDSQMGVTMPPMENQVLV
ncbi:hypothetical protein C5167_014077, partial [Papaver somniferum]